MTFAELLTDVIGRLDRAGVPYMVTGSLASSYHGEPRATRDADIVIDPTPESLARLVASLVDGSYYVDADVAYDALARRAQFNAVAGDATKIDFIIRKTEPFRSKNSVVASESTCSARSGSSPPPKTW